MPELDVEAATDSPQETDVEAVLDARAAKVAEEWAAADYTAAVFEEYARITEAEAARQQAIQAQRQEASRQQEAQASTPSAEQSPPSAPPPTASSGANWDALAQCESGGDWSYNGPSGFDGGLQFHPSTWTGAGGGQYAPEAWMATREQQIAIAERVLASSGRGAWPGCSDANAW